MSGAGGAERVEALPAGVRPRLIALASQAIAKMPPAQVPPSLLKSVDFAPAKGPNSSVDRSSRHSRSTRTSGSIWPPRYELSSPMSSLPSSGSTDSVGAPSQEAAVAFIIRSPGWADVVRSAALSSMRRRLCEATCRCHRPIDRRIGAGEGPEQEIRSRLRAQIDAVKADNAQLRRTLGATRTQLKDATQRADTALAAVDEERRQHDVVTRSLQAEIRRLRAKVTELESQNTSARRAVRDDRDAEVMRLRLLLDTMVDAVAGSAS